MAYNDLREYLKRLEQEGLLRWIDQEVDKDWELSCIMRALFRGLPTEKRFGVGFRNVKGYTIPVVVGVLGASKRIQAMAMETAPEVEKIHDKWIQAQENPLEPVIVPTGPCKEVVLKGKEIDLNRFPVPVWTPGRDPSPFFTPVWVSKNADTGITNVGMYRAQVKGRDRTGIYYSTYQHGFINQRSWEAKNKPMPAAIIVGSDPSLYVVGVTKIPQGVEEYAVAGGLRGKPLELVKCETIDLEVPATAEIIIEGEFLPNEREAEGPFGEWTGYMASAPFGMPVFHIKCITHRKDPIYLGMISQMPPSESSGFRQALYEGNALKHLKHDLKIPGIIDVHLPESTGCNGYLWVRIKNQYPGQVQHVADAVRGRMSPASTKWIVITDDDIDIRDPFAREWALGFRVRPECDIYITPVTAALGMDPSATEDENVPVSERKGAKVIIDATKKWAYPEIALPPRRYLDRVIKDWDKYGLPAVDTSWVSRWVPD